jgi:hypothetical protein
MRKRYVKYKINVHTWKLYEWQKQKEEDFEHFIPRSAISNAGVYVSVVYLTTVLPGKLNSVEE